MMGYGPWSTTLYTPSFCEDPKRGGVSAGEGREYYLAIVEGQTRHEHITRSHVHIIILEGLWDCIHTG